MEIKPQDIKDFLHLYIGCEITIKGHKNAILGAVGIDDGNRVIVRWPLENEWSYADLNEIKPILRKLSDMTGRDASNIVSAIPGMVVSDCYSFIQDWINGKSIMIQFETQVALTNEMRRREFDVDHLIPAGLAIDKTSLI